MNFKKLALSAAVATTLAGASVPAQAVVVDFAWSGLFTMLDSTGIPLTNTSLPYYDDPTWGFGLRTQISGTASFDTDTGAGTATVNPFEFFNGQTPAVAHSIQMQAIGDGMGGAGTLVAGRMLFDWNNNNNINVGIILDAAGMFTAMGGGLNVGDVITGGALPASNGIKRGGYPIGGAPMATTTYNTEYHNNGAFISGNDTVGGSPMDNGPFIGNNANFDITTMTVTAITMTNPIPVPAAVWLFGSGLLGLAGIARRRKAA